VPFPIDCNFNWCVDWVLWLVGLLIYFPFIHTHSSYTRPASQIIVHPYRCNPVRTPLATLEHCHREPHFEPDFCLAFSAAFSQSINQTNLKNQSVKQSSITIYRTVSLSFPHTLSFSLYLSSSIYCLPFVLPLFDYIK